MSPHSIDDLLGPKGPLPGVLPAFEHRDGQLEMARGVSDVLDSGGVLAVEAPTGIGKSLAYLIPAALHALRQQVPVAIATGTLNLQDQLLEKDLPIVAEVLAAIGEGPLRVTVLKGKSNYLCRRRWEEARRGLLALPPGMLERLAGWVVETETGELTEAEAALGPLGESGARLASDPASCNWGRCHRGDDCFIRRAWKRAQTSHLVILNHALLFNHLLRDSAYLPDADGLVLDEAHHLERALTDACGREVSIERVQGLVGRALGARAALAADSGAGAVDPGAVGPGASADDDDGAPPFDDLGTGAFALGAELARVGELGRLAERLRAIPSDVDRLNLGQRIGQVREGVERAAGLVLVALRAVGRRILSDPAGSLGASEQSKFAPNGRSLASNKGAFPGPGFGLGSPFRYNAETASELFGLEVDRARAAIEDLGHSLRDLAVAIDRVTASLPAESAGDWLLELTGVAGDWGWLGSDLAALAEPDDADVCWVDLERGAARLSSLPLEVADTFASRVLDRFRSAILTSATLTVAGSFDHLVARLGLDRRDRRRLHLMALDSPFEHARQCVLLADPGFTPPNAPGYAAAVANLLKSLVVGVPRRTLVLFTSNWLLREVWARVRPVAEAQGRPLFAQGLDGPRQVLARRFRQDAGAILLGTSSFWEGVDFPGEELEVLVITRLPFPVPSEPLIAARSEKLSAAGEVPFSSLFLPEAVLRFRQGFGRLIRSLDDRGAVICLDPRLLTSSYGEVFRRSLPVRPTMVAGELLAEAVAEWFATGEVAVGSGDARAARGRRGTKRTPQSVAEDVYLVDQLDEQLGFDPDADTVRERAAAWRGRKYATRDGASICVESLRPATRGPEKGES